MKRFGLIGHPLGHSMSPFIHARIMERAGIDGVYELFDIPPERLHDEAPRLIRELDGFNCTIPHKEKLAEILQSPFPVNTVFRGKGFNTDFAGFATCGIDFKDKDVLLLGAGGTARMMAQACAGAKSLTVCARKKSVGQAFLPVKVGQTFLSVIGFDRQECLSHIDRQECLSYAVVLNATPLGMWPRAGSMPEVMPLLRPGVEVFDAVYNPTPTRLVLNARKHGCRAVGGLRMLVRQAIEAQKIWNPDAIFDVEELERAILPEVSRELLRHSAVHVLLTGFMGAGKTSLAKELAKRLGIARVDLDDEIETQAGCSIADIFKRDGEAAFRGIERGVATRVLKSETSSVVATGGGFAVFQENQNIIRDTNTLVLHLDAPFDVLWQRVRLATARPLLQSSGQARALYDARQPVYQSFCDFIFDAARPVSELAEDVANQLTHTGD